MTPRNGLAREEGYKVLDAADKIATWRRDVAKALAEAKKQSRVIDHLDALQLLTIGLFMTGEAETELRTVKINNK